MDHQEMLEVMSNVDFGKWGFIVRPDYLQVAFQDTDNVTGLMSVQKGRKWRLSEHMTKSELVQTALAAVLLAVEHEVREQFTYRGQAIFSPHYDVDDLVIMCEKRRQFAGVR